MPGICGVVDMAGQGATHRHDELQSLVERMVGAMRYEAQYACDIFSCADLAACVGRVGRGIDGTRGAVKPGAASLVLVTTGEPVCGGDGDREGPWDDRMAWSGVGALGTGRLYARFGDDAVGRLNGVFAGFLMDRSRARCVLFNDRYGMERLFLCREGTRTFFSSEAKAILAVVPRTRSFDPEGLAQILACGGTIGQRSLFKDIEVLEGGSVVSFAAGEGVRSRSYFQESRWTNLEAVQESRFLEGFADSLRAAVNAAVRRQPGVGMSLTGGLDSRMLMACIEVAPGSLPCYTFGGMYRETFDVTAGRQVAGFCGQPHHVLELGEQFLRELPSALEKSVFTCDGYLGLSGAAELHLNRMARALAPCRITGNWGGELLRGVRAFKYVMPKGDFLTSELRQRVAESAEIFSQMARVHPLSFTLFHQAPNQGYGRYAIERSQVVMRSPFLDNDVVAWLYQAPVFAHRSARCSTAIIEKECPGLLAISTDLGLLGGHGGLGGSVRRLYRQGMAKAEYWTGDGATDWFVRLSGSGVGSLIEGVFRGRHKFQHYRPWLRKELAGFVRETLLGESQAELGRWFEGGRVEGMVNDHVAGRGNYSDEIDKLLTITLAGRSLFKSWPTGGEVRRGETLRGFDHGKGVPAGRGVG